jgi:hypothetical protein
MHRARHSGASSSLRRSRMLILLAVAGVGLAAALWLPTRNDSASATEVGRDRQQAQDQHHHHHHHWWDRDHRRDRRSTDPSASPSDSPSESPSEPPAPDVTAWAPFTDYTAGQLVSFKGVEYRVQETHTSLPGWEPPKLPAVFTIV